MAMVTETATPTERLRSIALREIAPPETSSTWWVSTWTAGSAVTMNQPTKKPTGSSSQRRADAANSLPK